MKVTETGMVWRAFQQSAFVQSFTTVLVIVFEKMSMFYILHFFCQLLYDHDLGWRSLKQVAQNLIADGLQTRYWSKQNVYVYICAMVRTLHSVKGGQNS